MHCANLWEYWSLCSSCVLRRGLNSLIYIASCSGWQNSAANDVIIESVLESSFNFKAIPDLSVFGICSILAHSIALFRFARIWSDTFERRER